MKNTPLIIYQTEDGKIKIETHFENVHGKTFYQILFDKRRRPFPKMHSLM
jgi:hypothetical protein